MGALGVSTSLQYVPDRFASTEELIALARVAGRYGGSYITHQRSEADQIDSSLDEVFRIAREAAVPATIHHLKTAYRQNWGRMPQVLARLERARAEGLDVAADLYPYAAASNRLDSNLPVWAREGGREALLARLKIPQHVSASRRMCCVRIRVGKTNTWGLVVLPVFSSRPSTSRSWRPIKDAGSMRLPGTTGKDPLDALMDLIHDDIYDRYGHHVHDARGRYARRAAPSVGRHGDRHWRTGDRRSDGIVLLSSSGMGFGDADSGDVRPRGGTAHTRGGREKNDLTAGHENEVVGPGTRATGLRGRPDRVQPRDRHRSLDIHGSEGVQRGRAYVMVNGELVVDEGRITDARPDDPCSDLGIAAHDRRARSPAGSTAASWASRGGLTSGSCNTYRHTSMSSSFPARC